jgi:hypothetical protein
MRIDIRDVQQALQLRSLVNSVPLDQIEFVHGDARVEFDPKLIEAFEFIGLSNLTFCETNLEGVAAAVDPTRVLASIRIDQVVLEERKDANGNVCFSSTDSRAKFEYK